MRWEIEPSGCCERKGMRQIRFCFYLEPGDARYNEHHVNLPVIPEGGYPGDLEPDEEGRISKSKLQAQNDWFASLPTKWQTNPFHNHFIRVPLDATDEDIAKQADALMPQFYGQWQRRERLGVKRGRN